MRGRLAQAAEEAEVRECALRADLDRLRAQLQRGGDGTAAVSGEGQSSDVDPAAGEAGGSEAAKLQSSGSGGGRGSPLSLRQPLPPPPSPGPLISAVLTGGAGDGSGAAGPGRGGAAASGRKQYTVTVTDPTLPLGRAGEAGGSVRLSASERSREASTARYYELRLAAMQRRMQAVEAKVPARRLRAPAATCLTLRPPHCAAPLSRRWCAGGAERGPAAGRGGAHCSTARRARGASAHADRGEAARGALARGAGRHALGVRGAAQGAHGGAPTARRATTSRADVTPVPPRSTAASWRTACPAWRMRRSACARTASCAVCAVCGTRWAG